MAADDRERTVQRLVDAALAADDPTGWFEPLYAAARDGNAVVPWNRQAPHPLLAEWTATHARDGSGRRAMVVGAGLGYDAAHVAGLGFATTAFDISATAVAAARERFPDSGVEFVTADLLDPPAAWREAFDLVVEIMTVQALPDPPRAAAIAQVARLVAPGGTLLVIAAAHHGPERDRGPGPPWPLTRDEVGAFAAGTGLDPVAVEAIELPGDPPGRRWRAQFRRSRGPER